MDVSIDATWRYQAADVCFGVDGFPWSCDDTNGIQAKGYWGATEFIHQQAVSFTLYKLIPISQTVDKMVPGAYTAFEYASTYNDWGNLLSARAGSGACVPDEEYYNPCYNGEPAYLTRIDCGDVGELSQFGFDITATIT